MMLNINNFSNNILEDISFSLDENLIILGPNGAGKSTLAKVISGLIESKSVTLFSKKLHQIDRKTRAKYINYIPPKLDIFDEYISIEEYLQLSHLDKTVILSSVISLLGLDDLKDKSCKTLSSGEQQLTLLASSLLHNAKLTIFDEPTANLDPTKILKIYKLLKSNHLKNMIVITHDLNLAYKLGYKILYLNRSKIEFFGDNSQFFNDDNLNKIFSTSIKKVDDYFVVNL